MANKTPELSNEALALVDELVLEYRDLLIAEAIVQAKIARDKNDVLMRDVRRADQILRKQTSSLLAVLKRMVKGVAWLI